jgi:ABC-type Fe3+ transport system substrate-binding protein
MNTKLTLSIDPEIKKKAKAYAKANNTSISKIVEQYLKQLSDSEERDDSWKDFLSPVVRDMVGSLDKDKVIDDERYQYLIKKYS